MKLAFILLLLFPLGSLHVLSAPVLVVRKPSDPAIQRSVLQDAAMQVSSDLESLNVGYALTGAASWIFFSDKEYRDTGDLDFSLIGGANKQMARSKLKTLGQDRYGEVLLPGGKVGFVHKRTRVPLDLVSDAALEDTDMVQIDTSDGGHIRLVTPLAQIKGKCKAYKSAHRQDLDRLDRDTLDVAFLQAIMDERGEQALITEEALAESCRGHPTIWERLFPHSSSTNLGSKLDQSKGGAKGRGKGKGKGKEQLDSNVHVQTPTTQQTPGASGSRNRKAGPAGAKGQGAKTQGAKAQGAASRIVPGSGGRKGTAPVAGGRN